MSLAIITCFQGITDLDSPCMYHGNWWVKYLGTHLFKTISYWISNTALFINSLFDKLHLNLLSFWSRLCKLNQCLYKGDKHLWLQGPTRHFAIKLQLRNSNFNATLFLSKEVVRRYLNHLARINIHNYR